LKIPASAGIFVRIDHDERVIDKECTMSLLQSLFNGLLDSLLSVILQVLLMLLGQ
jgi:hypothetical protein